MKNIYFTHENNTVENNAWVENCFTVVIFIKREHYNILIKKYLNIKIYNS